jgi:hypothetical protein
MRSMNPREVMGFVCFEKTALFLGRESERTGYS